MESILAALKAGQKGYLTVAAGAAAGDRGRYAQGEKQVKKADAALNDAGGLGVALLHLAALFAGFAAIGRLALRRFA